MTPLGILVLATGALTLIFGRQETSDFHGPHHSGTRTQFLHRQCILRMLWKGEHPRVKWLAGDYPDGVRVTGQAKEDLESRLERSSTLRKYDITIRPRQVG